LLAAAVTAAVTVTGSTTAGGVLAGAAVPGGRAAGGTQLWTARVRTVTDTLSEAMAVSPHGGTVFVTGESYLGRADGAGYQTMAYRAATGKRLWTGRDQGPGTGFGSADWIAASPNGHMVFVTGWIQVSQSPPSYEYLTIAYRS
jgi:hypothetical protein